MIELLMFAAMMLGSFISFKGNSIWLSGFMAGLAMYWIFKMMRLDR